MSMRFEPCDGGEIAEHLSGRRREIGEGMRESEEDDEVKAEGMERRGVEAMEGRAKFRVSMFGHNRSQRL